MTFVSLAEQIHQSYSMLSASEAKVADYISSHLTQVSRMSIRELRDAIGVSEPTIFRFCKVLGFQGFKEFKITLAEQTPTFQDYFTAPVNENKSELETVVERLLLKERDCIESTLQMLRYETLEQASSMVIAARRVLLFGVSTSYNVCNDLQRRLNRIGLSAWAFNEFHDAVAQLASCSSEDLLICVSQTGSTSETVETARKAQEFGVPVMVISAFPSSPLTRYATLLLQTCAPEVTNNRLGLTTRIAQYALVDALYMATAHRLGSRAATLVESSNVPLMSR